MTTHFCDVHDHSSNGECGLNWIGINTFLNRIEEHLRESPTHIKTVLGSRLPIRDLSLRIRCRDGSCNRSRCKAGFAVVLFATSLMSISHMQRLGILNLTLTNPADPERFMKDLEDGLSPLDL